MEFNMKKFLDPETVMFGGLGPKNCFRVNWAQKTYQAINPDP